MDYNYIFTVFALTGIFVIAIVYDNKQLTLKLVELIRELIGRLK